MEEFIKKCVYKIIVISETSVLKYVGRRKNSVSRHSSTTNFFGEGGRSVTAKIANFYLKKINKFKNSSGYIYA